MKICSGCFEDKSLALFVVNKRSKDGRAKRCKDCHNKYNKSYWKSSPARRLAVKKTTRELQLRNKTFVHEYLTRHSCISCGESNPVVLEFDHRDPKEKKFNISDGVRRCSTTDMIMDEIDKCDILCCNCHRVRTAKQFNWFRQRNPENMELPK